MDGERQLNIKVTTTADLSGANAAGAALNDLSAKTRKYIEDIGAGAKEVNHLEVSHHELREAINHVSREMPELGLVARYALNPWIASLGIILYGVGQITEAHKKLGEMLKESLDVSKILEASKALGTDGMVKALNEASEAGKTFLSNLDAIADRQQLITEKTNESIQALQHQAELTGKEKSAADKAAEAKIAADLASGKITPAQAAIQRARLAMGSAAASDQAASALESKTIAEKQKELDDIAKGLPDLRGNRIIQANQVGELQGKADTDKAKADDLRKQLQAQKDFMDKYVGADGYDYAANSQKYKQLLHFSGIADDTATASAGALERGKAGLAATDKQITELTEAINKLPAEIARLMGEHTANAASRGTQAASNTEAGQAGLLAQLLGMNGIGHAVGIQRIIDAHGKVTADQEQFYNTFLNQVRQQGGSIQQAANLLHSLATETYALSVRLSAAENLIRLMQQRGNNGLSGPVGGG